MCGKLYVFNQYLLNEKIRECESLLTKKTFSHPSKLSEFCRHLELCFLVAMVAYRLNCSIVNTLSINSSSVFLQLLSISLVRSHEHLTGRVAVRGLPRETVREMVFYPTFCFCLCSRKCVSALSFLEHLSIYSASCLLACLPYWTSA